MMLLRASLRICASTLRWASVPFLLVGSFATPILRVAAALDQAASDRAAREWNPRLWARGEDPRNDDRERP